MCCCEGKGHFCSFRREAVSVSTECGMSRDCPDGPFSHLLGTGPSPLWREPVGENRGLAVGSWGCLQLILPQQPLEVEVDGRQRCWTVDNSPVCLKALGRSSHRSRASQACSTWQAPVSACLCRRCGHSPLGRGSEAGPIPIGILGTYRLCSVPEKGTGSGGLAATSLFSPKVTKE